MFRRVTAAIILLIVAGILLALAWPQLFGLQRSFGFAHVVSLRGVAAAVGIALLVLLAVFGAIIRPARRLFASFAVLLVAFILLNAAVLSTRGFGDSGAEAAADSDVTVLSWNTLGDATGADAIAALALDSGADIITLPETTNELAFDIAAIMKENGKPMWLETTAYDQISKARSTSVLWSAELGTYSIDETVGSTSTLPSVVMRPDDGSGPTIIAVHAVSPIPGEFRNWRNDLGWLGDICAGNNTIMAGDFNATLDHMTGLGTGAGTALGGCVDAALV
ncbi:MAG: endonuclease/exonuclease/phosphatase family protein, partial [Microbacteriaceae bacterium]|nr:endonuclease/exonuclease/phosphatase family protein [Microbacteriaceae bacterium]